MTEHIVTKGIVLSRTDYQEADRILTILTPQSGKLRVIAKGVRRPKSKLAGGIELFSVNDITVLRGRSELRTLVSSRLDKHFESIVNDIERTMLGYDLLKQVHKATEEEPDEEYFYLLEAALAGLNDHMVATDLVELWFRMALLRANGNQPELRRDTNDDQLIPDENYAFDIDTMRFRRQDSGSYTANHIKLLRLTAAARVPQDLTQIQGGDHYMQPVLTLVRSIARQYA